MEVTECVSFVDYIKLSREVTDKVGFLTLTFKRLHPHAPADDLINLGGRIAGMWSKGHKDTGYLLEVIWVTAAKNPNGSHLNYIQAIINKQNVEKKPVQHLKRY
jgi:hypothetical protein